MLRSLVLGLLLSGPTFVGAQDRYTLTVQVRSGAEAIAGAAVRVPSQQTVSDSTGVARLTIGPGAVRLSAERIGYVSRDTAFVLRSDTTILLVLVEEALEEEAVVVLSTRGERRVEDEPLRVEVVNREEVEEKLLMTPGSIAMLLNETSGLRVQYPYPYPYPWP